RGAIATMFSQLTAGYPQGLAILKRCGITRYFSGVTLYDRFTPKDFREKFLPKCVRMQPC
ncbi:MAG: hypothetical protein AAF329_16765, partial [Cyanobacteria bacterium P01_A01_bin.17]